MEDNNSMRNILLEFPEFNKTIHIKLDDSQSPKTVKSILDNLPIKVKINRWGDELYTDKTQIIGEKENAKAVVNLLDVAYWPEGSALCLFYGPTPISKSKNEILPYSPVNVVGKIISKDNILDTIKESSIVIIKSG
jgi:hypothetical protein